MKPSAKKLVGTPRGPRDPTHTMPRVVVLQVREGWRFEVEEVYVQLTPLTYMKLLATYDSIQGSAVTGFTLQLITGDVLDDDDLKEMDADGELKLRREMFNVVRMRSLPVRYCPKRQSSMQLIAVNVMAQLDEKSEAFAVLKRLLR